MGKAARQQGRTYQAPKPGRSGRGGAVNGKVHTGNLGSYKRDNGDVVEIVFTTKDAKLPPKTAVPSYTTLPDVLGHPNQPEPGPGVTVPNGAAAATAPGGPTTAATTAPAATTTAP